MCKLLKRENRNMASAYLFPRCSEVAGVFGNFVPSFRPRTPFRSVEGSVGLKVGAELHGGSG